MYNISQAVCRIDGNNKVHPSSKDNMCVCTQNIKENIYMNRLYIKRNADRVVKYDIYIYVRNQISK